MKKTILRFVVFCMLVCLMPFDIHADEVKVEKENETTNSISFKKEEIGKKLFILEGEITETLTVTGNHYICDRDIIKELVKDFDIIELNNVFDTDYTIDSMTDRYVEMISNYEIPKARRDTPAYTCNLNASYSGWNYQRVYWDNATTKQRIIQFDMGDASLIKNLLIAAAGTAGALGSLSMGAVIAWGEDLSKALSKVNRSNCGVVVDFNILTVNFLYYEHDQKTFPGHF